MSFSNLESVRVENERGGLGRGSANSALTFSIKQLTTHYQNYIFLEKNKTNNQLYFKRSTVVIYPKTDAVVCTKLNSDARVDLKPKKTIDRDFNQLIRWNNHYRSRSISTCTINADHLNNHLAICLYECQMKLKLT